jgi:UPF0755 protein
MATYSLGVTRHAGRLPKRLWLLLLVLVIGIGTAVFGVRTWYDVNLQPVSTSTQKQHVIVATGATLNQIAQQLADAKLIRSSQAFVWYVSVHDARDKLQAGTYNFMSSESTSEIADAIIRGTVATDSVTILPGQRLDQVKQAFVKAGFSAMSMDAALQPGQYRNQYAILSDNPPTATLEGFLYPDTFQKTATTDPREIIGQSLSEMQLHLTYDIRSGFIAHGLTVYRGITLASIVEQEVPGQNDRNQAAQVFLKRLQMDMLLGSDVTAFYGAIRDGVSPSVTYDSPYNTRLHKGLPPGPISNVTASSLEAVAHPAATDWLYFVAGDDGVTHFAKTVDEHNANVARYCHKLCEAAQ